jgi:transcription initiation factor IIF auxiliary subunit
LGTIKRNRPEAAPAPATKAEEITTRDVSNIAFTNTSRNVGGGRWNWTIYVQAPADVLDQIACVEYTLHITYPNNVRRVCEYGDRTRPFGLSSSGWAPTHVAIRLRFRNGVEHRLSHTLVFEP